MRAEREQERPPQVPADVSRKVPSTQKVQAPASALVQALQSVAQAAHVPEPVSAKVPGGQLVASPALGVIWSGCLCLEALLSVCDSFLACGWSLGEHRSSAVCSKQW